jgi:4-amino-4-deoxy-L-arabinose transferase-like glycosyltransferase
VRVSVVFWGSWVLVTGLTFSFMAGIIHPYYTVALAPGVAGLAGLGGVLLWQRRAQLVAALPLAAAIVVAGLMAFELLGRSAGYVPWLRWAVLLGAVAAGVLVLAAAAVPGLRMGLLKGTTAALAVAASLAGPLAYSLTTAATPHSGAIVSAGPAATGMGRGGAGGLGLLGGQNGTTGTGPFRQQARGTSAGMGAGGAGGGGMGGLLGATTPSEALVTALKTGAGSYTWTAAVVGSNNAAGYQLATELPVMALGGFNGTDPSPTLAEFQQLVAEGRIHFFIGGRMMQGETGSDAAAQIAAWVEANFDPQTVGGTTVYLLAS